MHDISDDDLLVELKKRFKENKESIDMLRVLTKKLEDVNVKLQESESMKSNFISNIRNEYNNPLSSIMGLAGQLTEMSPREPDDVRAAAMSIFREAFDLDFILRNIFAAAEVEAGEARMSVSRVHVPSLLGHAAGGFRHQIDEKGIRLDVSSSFGEEGDGPFFMTDGEKLGIVVENLISNAIKFSSENGTVEVKVGRNGGDLEFAVTDHGIGIEKSELEKIFERFRQLDSGSAKRYRGQGLGLSVTRAYVQMLMGSIEVTSTVGKGSTFMIRIPDAGGGMAPEMLTVNGNVFIFQEEDGTEGEF